MLLHVIRKAANKDSRVGRVSLSLHQVACPPPSQRRRWRVLEALGWDRPGDKFYNIIRYTYS